MVPPKVRLHVSARKSVYFSRVIKTIGASVTMLFIGHLGLVPLLGIFTLIVPAGKIGMIACT